MNEGYEKDVQPTGEKHMPPPGEKHYICQTCKEKYDLTWARRRMMACCGQPLLRTEVIAKSSPEPFGP